MKLQSFLSTPVFFVVAMVMAGCYLAAAAFPALQYLEWLGFAAALVILADVIGAGIARWRLVRTRTPARGWASRLFDALPPERDDRIWSPEQLAAIKASMEAGEPHRFNLIGDLPPLASPRALEELTPIDYHVELPPHPVVDRAVLEPWPPAGFEHLRIAAARPVKPEIRDFGLKSCLDDDDPDGGEPTPETGHESEILATTTLPTGSESTQEARSGAVSGDSQLLDKDRDAWGNEVHGAVKGLVESDGVALTPHEEADLRKRVHAFMAGGEELHAYSDTVTIDQTIPSRLPGRAEAIRNSTFGKDMEARAFAALSGEAEAFTRGIVPEAGTAAALIREVEAKHGTLRQTDPDGTVTETTIPVSDKGEVHMLDVAAPADGEARRFIHPTSGDPYGPRIRLDSARIGDDKPSSITATMDTQLPAAGFGLIAVDPVPVMVMGESRMEAHTGPLHWQEDELERALGSGGMVLTSPPAGPVPIAKVEYDQRALRLLRPDPVGDSRANHRRRYWEDRYDAMNPEITEADLQRRLLDRPMDAASVRKAVAAVTDEVRTYTPPSLQLGGPESIPQLGGALIPVDDVRHLAMVRVADVGALAVSLAVDNDHLRNELNASMAMRQEAARQLAMLDLNEDGRHPSEDLGAMSRADAKALCIKMGWLIQQETVAVWAEPSDYD